MRFLHPSSFPRDCKLVDDPDQGLGGHLARKCDRFDVDQRTIPANGRTSRSQTHRSSITHNQAVVWTDSKEARIFRFNATDVEREHIRPQNLFTGDGALISSA